MTGNSLRSPRLPPLQLPPLPLPPCRAWAGLLTAALLAVSIARGIPARADDPLPAKPAAVASVNGHVLTDGDFRRRCEQFVGGVSDTAVGWVVLREWLQQTLAEDDAAKRGLLPGREDVERRIKALSKQWEFRGEKLEEWLASRGRSLDTLRGDIREQLIAENMLTDGIKVTDVEALNYYAGNKQVFGVGEQLRCSRITVDDRKAAQEIDAALKKGLPFEELARKRSIDPYRDQGGLMPEPVDADPKAAGPLEKEVLQRALLLDKGKPSGPIKLDNYWVFVRVEERLPARAPDLEDIRDLISSNLRIQKAGPEKLKAAQDHMNQLFRDAKIEILRPEYAGLLKTLQAKD